MVFDLNSISPSKVAMRDSCGASITYGQLVSFIDDFKNRVVERSLVFILSTNTVSPLAAIIACIECKVVPLILGGDTNEERLNELVDLYKPNFVWCEANSVVNDTLEEYMFIGCSLYKLNPLLVEMNSSLAFLLSTSGSTGSPKLVRHSYRNLKSSLENVSTLFALNGEERALATLPLQYTMGLSVACSHIYSGSQVLLCNEPMTSIEFWNFIKEQKATSFTGVPYNYEVLDKLRFFRMNFPHLKVLSQGGGKLKESLWKKITDFCDSNDMKFIATYGQTEGTARMAYLPSEFSANKVGSIGKSVKNGVLYLEDEFGNKIDAPNIQGELIYEGTNVTLGYAYCSDDLNKGDTNGGLLRTGDFAIRDEDGFFYIQGRKSRFLKIFGLRISLDHLERIVSEAFDVPCACKGNDNLVEVFLENYKGDASKVKDFIVEQSGLFHKVVEISVVQELHRTSSGKIKL